MSLSLHERTCPVRSGLRRPRNSILALLQVTRQFSTMSTAQRRRDGLDPHHVGKRGSPRLIFRTRIDVEQRETQLLHHRLIRLAQARLILILREDTNLGIKRATRWAKVFFPPATRRRSAPWMSALISSIPLGSNLAAHSSRVAACTCASDRCCCTGSYGDWPGARLSSRELVCSPTFM